MIVFLLSFSTILQAQRIRSSDVDNYVKVNELQFVKDYQVLIKDSIYNDIFIKTADFKKLFGKKYSENKNTLAFNAIDFNSCEITVNNEERYAGYDYLSIKNKEWYGEQDYFLRATVMHEISHYYFYQCALELEKIKNVEVNQYYRLSLFQYPNAELSYGAKFIEEGICEYLKYYWKLSPAISNDYQPKNINDIVTNGNKYEILYGYSSQFVKDFIDCSIKQYGRPKNAIEILLHNKPPSYEEILKPEKFYGRLSIY